MADVYYLTERQARKEIEERNRLQKTLAYKEKLLKEEQMRDAAAKAREEKNRLLLESHGEKEEPDKDLTEQETNEKKERDQLRYIRKREIEREKRIDVITLNFSFFHFVTHVLFIYLFLGFGIEKIQSH